MLTLLLLVFLLVQTDLGSPAIVGECSKKRLSNRCTAANSFWQYDGICIEDPGSSRVTCHTPDPRKFSFRLVSSIVQLDTPRALPIPELWIRGYGPGLSWEKSREMIRVKKGHWVLPIEYEHDSNALVCLMETRCTLNQRALEFRVYRDEHGVDEMLGPNIYIPLPISNSVSGHRDFSPPNVIAYPWFDGKRVLAKNYTFIHRHVFDDFCRYTNVTVFYPPSYEHNTLKRYPVVIILANEVSSQLVPLLESMYVHEPSIEEAFILALYNIRGPPLCEYNPFVIIGSPQSYLDGNHENLRYDCFNDPEKFCHWYCKAHRRDYDEQCRGVPRDQCEV